jgi:outer membrane beta-barrel protein
MGAYLVSLYLILFLFFQSSFALENSIYDFEWMDQDKKIYVLQNRTYKKKSMTYISLLGAMTASNKLIDSYYGIVKIGHFFSEDLGVEFLGGMGTGSINETGASVREQGAVPFYRRIDNYLAAAAIWSPFYGKFNAFDAILYLDWFFTGGFGVVSTSDNRNEFEITRETTLTKDSSVAVLWSTGFLFYINKNWQVRSEFQALHFKADKFSEVGTTDGSYTKSLVFNHYDFSLGINFMF